MAKTPLQYWGFSSFRIAGLVKSDPSRMFEHSLQMKAEVVWDLGQTPEQDNLNGVTHMLLDSVAPLSSSDQKVDLKVTGVTKRADHDVPVVLLADTPSGLNLHSAL